MKFKPAEIAIIRTTGEPVLVLETNEGDAPYAGFTGTKVKVRRPVETREGIIHKLDEFLEEELETESALMARKLQQFTNMMPRQTGGDTEQLALPIDSNYGTN